MAKVFQSLLDKAIQSGIIKEKNIWARTWFMKQMEKTNIKFSSNRIINDNKENQRRRPEWGKMYIFKYSPKLELTLPYYDIYPLIIVTRLVDDGFYGINFHYLPYNYRARFLDALFYLANTKTLDEKTKILVTYNLLKASSRFKYFGPCFKRYLYKQLETKFLQIDASEWNTAMFLPLEKFESHNNSTINRRNVWDDSKSKIKGN